jgi:hypothetical protein
VQEVHIFRGDPLVGIVVVHLNVLVLGMKHHRVLCQLYAIEVIVVDWDRHVE